MKITPLSEHIGAEVTGVDLRRDVDDAARDSLYAALVESVALVIRDQDLTARQFVEAGRLFGDLMPQDPPEKLWHPEQPMIRQVANFLNGERVNGTGAGYWHTDHTNHEFPPKFTILFPVVIPPSGSGTSVFNTRAAYESLDADSQADLAELRTVNVLYSNSAREAHPIMNEATTEAQRTQAARTAIHPIVRTNPDTGAKALYFHSNKTKQIVGMDPEESQRFLDGILSRAFRPEFVYTHHWRKGDVLIWDNRAAMHKAGTHIDPSSRTFSQDEPRLLWRLLVQGERPV